MTPKKSAKKLRENAEAAVKAVETEMGAAPTGSFVAGGPVGGGYGGGGGGVFTWSRSPGWKFCPHCGHSLP